MNVLHVINGVPISGGMNQIYNYIKNSQHSHMCIVNLRDGYSYIEKLAKANIECILSDLEYSNLVDVVKKHKIDIVHKQTGGGDCPSYVQKLYDHGIPLAETLHCPRKSAIPEGYVKKIHAHFSYTASLNPGRNVVVIPFPIDLAIGETKKALWPDKKMVVGRLARYEPSKMQDFIIKVAHYIRGDYPQHAVGMIFKIGGFANTVYEKAYLANLKRSSIAGYIEVVDFVSEEDKESFIASYDLYLNPTQNEANYSFFEPMTKGIPVISNPTEMTKDLFVCKWADLTERAFSEAIIEYYIDKEKHQRDSTRSIDMFKKLGHDIETHTQKMDKFYEDAIGV